jgi:hypothetical protein
VRQTRPEASSAARQKNPPDSSSSSAVLCGVVFISRQAAVGRQRASLVLTRSWRQRTLRAGPRSGKRRALALDSGRRRSLPARGGGKRKTHRLGRVFPSQRLILSGATRQHRRPLLVSIHRRKSGQRRSRLRGSTIPLQEISCRRLLEWHDVVWHGHRWS